MENHDKLKQFKQQVTNKMSFVLFWLWLTVTTLKICLSPGLTWADNDWWSSSSWTFLEQPQHFKPTPASRYPHRTKNLIFPVASRTFWQTEFTSCQEKHLSFHFLKGKTRTIKIPPSFGCFASPKMHKMHVRCKDANFLCNFFLQIFSAANGSMPTVKNPTAVKSRSQTRKIIC